MIFVYSLLMSHTIRIESFYLHRNFDTIIHLLLSGFTVSVYNSNTRGPDKIESFAAIHNINLTFYEEDVDFFTLSIFIHSTHKVNNHRIENQFYLEFLNKNNGFFENL